MDEHRGDTKAALCYLGLWVSGLLALVFVRGSHLKFHAVQSVLVFGILNFLLFLPFVGRLLFPFVMLVGLILWLFLIVSAYEGKEWKVPGVGELARRMMRDER